MNDFETRLAGRMHDLAVGETGGTPPTQAVLVRGRQARHRRRAMVTGMAAAVVVVAGAVTAAVPWSSSPGPAADNPAVRLAAAVEASDDTSYRVKVTTSAVADRERTEVTEGAFDPATRTGHLSAVVPAGENAYLERLVDGVRYVGCANCADQWKQYPGTHDRLAYATALDSAASASADPEALFDVLTRAGAEITTVGDGFHFEVDTTDEHGAYPVTLVGDVALGPDNRIARVTYQETITVPNTKNSRQPTTTTAGPAPTTTEAAAPTEFLTATNEVTVELFDYGTPVTVQRPTDVVVVQENP